MSIKNIEDSLNTVNNVSADLEKIDENKDNIASNLEKINNIKKSYLKNVYNILQYNQKTQIDFQNTFYEKIFDLDSKINDFIEINFKLNIEFYDTDDRHYVKASIDDNIFYNFITDVRKIKFVIRFRNTSSSRIIKLFYTKNDNYRLILKHYST